MSKGPVRGAEGTPERFLSQVLCSRYLVPMVTSGAGWVLCWLLGSENWAREGGWCLTVDRLAANIYFPGVSNWPWLSRYEMLILKGTGISVSGNQEIHGDISCLCFHIC